MRRAPLALAIVVVGAPLLAAVATLGACDLDVVPLDAGASDFAAISDDDGGGGDDLAGRDLASGPPPTPFVYVSGYTTTITRYLLDTTLGSLTVKGMTTATGSPSFLAADPSRRHLYAVDETNSKVEAFAIDPANGALTHVGTDQNSGGTGPAHLTVDGSGKWVLVANYGSGDVGVLPIVAGTGGVNAGTSLHAGTNAHEVVLDAANQHAWVPCLGSNYVAQYNFDAATGKLTAGTPPTVGTPAGSGPRHLALHPTRALAFLIEETDSMLGVYTVAGGNLTLLQRQSTRANGAAGTNTGAEVQVHPSGKFVYVSNRGDDDIGAFSVGSDGRLTPIAHTKTGGQTPRHFSIDRSGRWLLVANQGSGDVHIFAIDATSGLLSPGGAPVTFTMPSYVAEIPLP
jgi:6-phosphogluconolactonase